MSRIDRLSAVAAVCCVLSGASLAQVPSEVSELGWCSGSKDCLEWSPVGGATSYNLYQGSAAGLPGLVDGTEDSCAVGTYAQPTTGTSIGELPPVGGLRWYLVSASNPAGEGSAGAGSGGARVVDSFGPCSLESGLVINEVDYDQSGSDTAEFVEIYNAGTSEYGLQQVAMVLVNGLSSFEYARVDLSTAAPGLAPGEFLVVGTEGIVSGLPVGTPSVTWASSNNIQNGAPDGIALIDLGSGSLLDALSYEGSISDAQIDGLPGTYDLVEGDPATAEDSNSTTGSLARFPDGADSNDAAVDWIFVGVPTPGVPNAEP